MLTSQSFYQDHYQEKHNFEGDITSTRVLKLFKCSMITFGGVPYNPEINYSSRQTQFFFNPNPTRKKFLIPETRPRTRKKLVFKPEPDPISGLSRVGSGFFSFRVPDAGLW